MKAIRLLLFAHPSWDKYSTGVGITRPDLVICNLSALPLIKQFAVRRDLSVRSHVGLQIVLRRHQSILSIFLHSSHPRLFQ